MKISTRFGCLVTSSRWKLPGCCANPTEIINFKWLQIRPVWRSRIHARTSSYPGDLFVLVRMVGVAPLCWLLHTGLLGRWQCWGWWKGWKKCLVLGEQETGPKEGRGITKQPKSANQCYSSAFGGHWWSRERSASSPGPSQPPHLQRWSQERGEGATCTSVYPI